MSNTQNVARLWRHLGWAETDAEIDAAIREWNDKALEEKELTEGE